MTYMTINNIQATKFFDEVRTYFGTQAHTGKAIELVAQAGRQTDGVPFIGIADRQLAVQSYSTSILI